MSIVTWDQKEAFPLTVSVFWMIAFLFYIPWAVVSLHLRTIWFALLLVALLYIHNWWSVGIVVIGCLLIYMLLSRQMTKEAVSIVSPAPHQLYVWQGGNTLLLNHHWRHPAQRYAFDLVGLDASGRRARGLFPKALTAYSCFGMSLLSPLAGTVVHTENDHPDLAVGLMDKEHVFGNCIVIQSAAQPHIQVVLAHLMSRSVTVQPGSVVQPGEIIGRIGNSGNTSEPHLHTHAQKMENGKLKGVPIKIDGRQLMRNMVIHT